MKKIMSVLLIVLMFASCSGCATKHMEEIPVEIYNAYKENVESIAEDHNTSINDFKLSLLSIKEERYTSTAYLSIQIDIPNIEEGGYTQADYSVVSDLSSSISLNSFYNDLWGWDDPEYIWVDGKNRERYDLWVSEITITSNGSVYTVDSEEKDTKAYYYLRKDGEIVYEWSYVISAYRGETDNDNTTGNEYDYNGNNKWDSNEWNDALDDYLTENGY